MTSTLLRNVVVTAFQFAANALILFAMYRYLMQTLGVEQVGLWSLVLTSISFGSMAQSGMSNAVTKFVATHLARDDIPRVTAIIRTALLLNATAITAILLIAYIVAYYVLPSLIPVEKVPLARSLLPYAVVSGWLALLSVVLRSALAGRQVIAIPRLWMLLCAVVYLLLTLLWVPNHGLIGVAYAQMVQTGAEALGCLILLYRNFPGMPPIPIGWRKDAFREIFGYGVKVQVTSVCELLLDPITKALIARFGGLAIVGYYDIAARMGLLIRGTVFIAAESLVPFVSNLFERNSESLERYYKLSMTMMLVVSVMVFGIFIAMLPTVTWIFFNQDVFLFRAICIIVCFGWFGNTLAGPATFFYMGEGELKWFAWSGVIALAVTSIFGLAGSIAFGGEAAIASWALAKWVSALVLIITYHQSHGFGYFQPILQHNGGILLSGVAGILLALASVSIDPQPILGAPVYAMCFMAPFSLALWTHPLRPQLTTSLTQWRRRRG